MSMLQSILLAVECREAETDVVSAAEKLATTFGSEVILTHVVEKTHPDLQLLRLQHAESFLEKLSQRLLEKQIKADRIIIKSGSPAALITSLAQDNRADLIILGAGVRKHSREFTLGPVAEAVISHASQPVLAIRPGTPETLFRKILCPVDHSRTSFRGLQNAIRLARLLGSEILVLSVIPDVSWVTAATETGVIVDARIEHASEWVQEFERFLKAADFAGITSKSEVRHGVPHEQIVAAAGEFGSDLIVMGATGRTGLVKVLLGSTTRRLLRNLPCSLLTVKQDEVLEELFDIDLIEISRLITEARSLANAKSFQPAIALYQQALNRNPFHLEALHELSDLFQATGQTRQEEQCRHRIARIQSMITR